MQEPSEWQISTNASRILQELDEFEKLREKEGPPLTAEDRENVRILRRDAMHHVVEERDKNVFGNMARLKNVELQYLHQILGIRQQGPSAIFGSGYCGYGNGWTGNKMRLLYAQNRKRYGRKSCEVFMPIQLQGSTTYMEEELVPIRIDFENDKYKLQDSFTWNLKDTTIPLEVFVENLLEDFHLPLSLSPHIVQSIKEQLDGYCFHIAPRIGEGHEASAVRPEPAESQPESVPDDAMEDIESDSTTVKSETSPAEPGTAPAPAQDAPVTVDAPTAPEPVPAAAPVVSTVPAALTAAAAPAAAAVPARPIMAGQGPGPKEPLPINTDMRITIKLDISIGQHVLNDQFEWDMNCDENSPEEFAVVMCAELALSPEFETAIAHSIREQCQAHTKMLYVVGYQFDGRQPQVSDFKHELSPDVTPNSFLRNPMLLQSFAPVVHEVPVAEFEKHDRDGRRRRRQGRTTRRGMASTYPVPAQLGAQVTVNDLKETSRSSDTPVFSSLLPGGLDQNLAILRATATGLDENTENGPESTAYYLRIRNRKDIPSGALFKRDLPESHQQRYIVKLKIPTAAEMAQRQAQAQAQARLAQQARQAARQQAHAQPHVQPHPQSHAQVHAHLQAPQAHPQAHPQAPHPHPPQPHPQPHMVPAQAPGPPGPEAAPAPSEGPTELSEFTGNIGQDRIDAMDADFARFESEFFNNY